MPPRWRVVSGFGPRRQFVGSQGTKYLLICNTADGFVAQFNGVVVQLQLAQRLGFKPIVYLHKHSYMFGGPNPYFDESEGPNAWEYYYDAIGVSSDELATLVRDGKVYTLTTASELFRLFRWDPRSFFMNPFGYYKSVQNQADGSYPSDWWLSQRQKARAFLEDGTIRINDAVRQKVDQFVEKKFSKNTLGLQLRGSDKMDFGSGPNLGRKVLPEEYFPYIDKYLAEHPDDTKIFVATDQRQWLKVMEEAYPGKILSFAEISLSDTNENRLHDAENKALRGTEVLVDVMLLSRCDYLLKCHAAVGEMALVLNPNLQFLDLNYEHQYSKVKPAFGYAITAPVIRLLCDIWRSLAENGMSLTQVTSVDGDQITVDPSHPRQLNTKELAEIKAPRSPLFSGRFLSDVFDRLANQLATRCFRYEDQQPKR